MPARSRSKPTSAAKPPKPQATGLATPGLPATTEQSHTLLQAVTKRHGYSALQILALFVVFKWFLPWIADMTPPGVDPRRVAAAAHEQAIAATKGCADACRGMACPAGWTTGRAPDDPCKCICVRLDPGSSTPWDEERKKAAAAKQAPETQGGQQQSEDRHNDKRDAGIVSQPPADASVDTSMGQIPQQQPDSSAATAGSAEETKMGMPPLDT